MQEKVVEVKEKKIGAETYFHILLNCEIKKFCADCDVFYKRLKRKKN